MARQRSEVECMSPNDFAYAAYTYGYNGESLAACVRGLGMAATGYPLRPAARRGILQGFLQGEHDRAIDDANPGDFGGPIDYAGVPF